MIGAEGLRAQRPPEVVLELQPEGPSAAPLGDRTSLVSLDANGHGARPACTLTSHTHPRHQP